MQLKRIALEVKRSSNVKDDTAMVFEVGLKRSFRRVERPLHSLPGKHQG